MQTLNRLPPQDIEAEQGILGAILLENEAILKAKLKLNPNDFYKQSHGKIYNAMLNLKDDGEPVDIITLSDRLRKTDELEVVGGASYLSRLSGIVPTSANILYHCDIVHEKMVKRNLLRSLIETTEGIYNDTDSLDNLLSKLRNDTAGLVRGRGSKITTMRDLTKELMEFIERRSENKNEISGVPSGFIELDNLTDGFQGGEQIIIAARPGTGKSALAMVCAINAGVPVGIISIEMGSHQMGIRTLSSISGVELWKLRKGILSVTDWHKLTTGCVEAMEKPIYFAFSSKNTAELERTVTQMVELYGCKEIIVDYLQLTKSAEPKKREQEVAEVSRTLKLCATNNNIPMIVLSALNRDVEKRQNKVPVLSDLRESGAIEQDADVVIFLHQKDGKEHEHELELHVAKGRNCGLGQVKLYVDFDTMTFKNFNNESW